MAIIGSKLKLNNFEYALNNELNGCVLLDIKNNAILDTQYVDTTNIDIIRKKFGTVIGDKYYFIKDKKNVEIVEGLLLSDYIDFSTVNTEILKTITNASNPSKLIDACDIDWRPYHYSINGKNTNICSSKDVLDMIESYGKQLYSFTYDELKILVENNSLSIGAKYIINDYQTTTYSNIENPTTGTEFKLILTADTIHSFNCKAMAVDYSGADASKWEIWYDFENDNSKYSWATSTGKGVIYRMIDEYGNDCPYDFKSIKFGDNFTFGGSTDDSLTGESRNNVIKPYISARQHLNNIVIGKNAVNNYFGYDVHDIQITNDNDGYKDNCNNITIENEVEYVDLKLDITTGTTIDTNITIKSGIQGTSTEHKEIKVDNTIFNHGETKNIEFKPANNVVYEI